MNVPTDVERAALELAYATAVSKLEGQFRLIDQLNTRLGAAFVAIVAIGGGLLTQAGSLPPLSKWLVLVFLCGAVFQVVRAALIVHWKDEPEPRDFAGQTAARQLIEALLLESPANDFVDGDPDANYRAGRAQPRRRLHR